MSEKKSRNRYAVVDLEATGTGSHSKIIQIGIVLIEDGQIVERFETDINPHEAISTHIQQLTGITNAQLAQAPDFSQVASQIFDLLEGRIFVAHNVKFDGNLLTEALFLEGYELHVPWVDTVELAQLIFPTFEKYTLTNLAEELSLSLEQAHTAIADADATAQLLLVIQDKIASLPKTLVAKILDFADSLLYESRLVIEEIYRELTDQIRDDLERVNGLFLKRAEEAVTPRPLSKEFDYNIALLGLEERELQAQFAQLVEDGLQSEQQVHFIQAGSGIGKTYGYLLPLLAQTDEQILVSVPTKLLQAQLMEQEGRRLEELFNISFCSIKSARHFIKLERFWKSLEEEESNRLINRCKMQLLVWLCETKTGDMDELKQAYRYQSYLDTLRHDGNVAADSLFAEWDFWRKLQSKAYQSRVLVTNHSYLLHNVKDQAYLFQHRLCIFDEAQKLLLTAEEMACQKINLSSLAQQFQSKVDTTEVLLERRLYESCLFEMQELLVSFKVGELADLPAERFSQLTQNLKELADPDFFDVQECLSHGQQFWLEKEKTLAKPAIYLCAGQLDFIEVASLLPKTKTFCISATLDISKHIHLSDLLGYSDVATAQLPQTYTQQQKVILSKDFPDFYQWNIAEQAAFVAKELEDLERVGKPCLVLFTSQALLVAVSERLELDHYPHLAQYRHGNEVTLKKRFEKGETQLLLGSGVFWEGVDFSQQPDLLLVLPRLPFENPQDHLVQKINRSLREKGRHPFYEYSLPLMLLKLKQAIGRTKRVEAQRSAIIILDNRVETKRYSWQIKRFLKENYLLESLSKDDVIAAAQAFFTESQSKNQSSRKKLDE